MFLTAVVEKIKTHILCLISFFPKIMHLWDNVEKYGVARLATEDNKTQCRKDAICTQGNESKNTHSQYLILIAT